MRGKGSVKRFSIYKTFAKSWIANFLNFMCSIRTLSLDPSFSGFKKFSVLFVIKI